MAVCVLLCLGNVVRRLTGCRNDTGMSDEQSPEKPKRTLGRELPKILQGGGPVMIFGAKRSTSAIVNAASSNPEESVVDPANEDGRPLTDDAEQE